MKPRCYKPTAFVIAIMLAGLGTIVFLKLRKNGLAVSGWMDVAFYLLAPIAMALIVNLFFARILIDEQQIEISGLLSRRRYALSDITQVHTAKGADVTFDLKDARRVTLPSWTGADAWSIAAVLRKRIGQGVPADGS